jgi:uncharacterized protein (DUF924 family)
MRGVASAEIVQFWRDAEPLTHTLIHCDVVRRFGRFPRRDHVLGRTTTPAKQRFLDESGLSG